jgi:selenium metabolism protein YedF
MLIDARGLGCPKPVMMAQDALAKIDEGIVEILVDNEASAYNLTRFASKNGFYSDTTKEDNYWMIKIVKGFVCEVPQKETELEKPEKDLFLLVATDTMGKEEELGKILMKGFFETTKVTKEIPHTIFFLNAGVKLTTLNKEIIPTLKELESMGIEIFTCGTCLKYYNLESELKVGYRGTTDKIIEGIKDFKNTIWIG